MDEAGFYILIGTVSYLSLLGLVDFGVPLIRRWREIRDNDTLTK